MNRMKKLFRLALVLLLAQACKRETAGPDAPVVAGTYALSGTYNSVTANFAPDKTQPFDTVFNIAETQSIRIEKVAEDKVQLFGLYKGGRMVTPEEPPCPTPTYCGYFGELQGNAFNFSVADYGGSVVGTGTFRNDSLYLNYTYGWRGNYRIFTLAGPKQK